MGERQSSSDIITGGHRWKKVKEIEDRREPLKLYEEAGEGRSSSSPERQGAESELRSEGEGVILLRQGRAVLSPPGGSTVALERRVWPPPWERWSTPVHAGLLQCVLPEFPLL